MEKSGSGDLHLTLEQILIRLREIFNSMMTEKEKFEEIEKIYNSGNIPGILADQNIQTNKLATKRTELQQKLIGKSIWCSQWDAMRPSLDDISHSKLYRGPPVSTLRFF